MKKREEAVVSAVKAMCEVYRQEPSTMMINIWIDAVKELRLEVIAGGLEEVFKTHKEFMPTPAQFRACCETFALRMRIEPEPLEKQRRLNVLDEVREIAREMYPGYDKLDARKDARKIEKLFRHANIVRYLRSGVEPNWIPTSEVDALRRYAK